MRDAADCVFYAHSLPREPLATWERLEWHLRRAGALARRFGRRFDAGATAAASGLLHDVGKYSDAFQRRIIDDAGRVDHATGGAKEAVKLYGEVLGRLLAYGIAGHHGGLPNGGNADDRTLLSRLESTQIPPGYDRWKGRVRVPAPENLAMELVWGFSCQAVVWVVLTVFCSERERPLFVPAPAIRFPERAEGVKGPKC